MKKVLVAGTALMLAGAAAVQAQAEVSVTGDARVTYIGKQDYLRDKASANGYDDFFESRVGLNIDGKAPANGVGAKARVYFDGYGFEDDAPWNGQERTELSVDYAYLTAPLGDWNIKAGRVNLDYSKFFSWNIRPTRVLATYKQGDTSITPFVGVRAEASTDKDTWNDNDYTEYGLVLKSKLQNAWNVAGYVRYDDDQRTEKSSLVGLTASATDAAGKAVSATIPVLVTGPAKDKSGMIADVFLNNEGANCDFGFHAELAYKAADVQGTEDDGFGGYAMLSKAMSSQFTPAILAGMTKDGYVADNDFGFVMVGGDTSTQVLKVGDLAPEGLWFGAFVANYKASERMTLTGNFLYADYDNSNAGTIDSAIEVSGVADYVLNDSSSLTYKIGYLTPSYNGDAGSLEDAYFAHYLRLNVKF